MSARDAMAAMLDELMGPQRNASGWTPNFSFRDESVCKYALAEFCPHDMFTHTKGDLGQCPQIHDDKLRLEYHNSTDYCKLGYEKKLLMFLEKLHDEMQHNIKSEKRRLQAQYGGDKEKEMRDLEEEIAKNAQKAEEAGNKGDVEECKRFMDRIEVLRAEKDKKEKINEVGHREMEVCEICGRRLIVGDAPSRVEEHLTGKMHVGYIKIAETITELKNRIEQYAAKREAERESSRRDRGGGDERRRSSRSRSRDRKRSRSRDRDRRRSTTDRRRSRSRSRDRKDGRDGDRRRSRR